MGFQGVKEAVYADQVCEHLRGSKTDSNGDVGCKVHSKRGFETRHLGCNEE